MKIKKITREIEKDIVLKEAHYIDNPTGRFRTYIIEDENGNETREKEPITERVLVEPKIKKIVEKKTFYCVNIDSETHEFENERDAKSFIRGLK